MPIELDMEIEENDLDLDIEVDESIKVIADPKVIKPLTITENGVYDMRKADKPFDGANPITVKIPTIKVESLTVTENGIYEGPETDGKKVAYSPIIVDVLSVAKLLNMKGGVLTSSFFEHAKELNDEALQSICSNVGNIRFGDNANRCFAGCENITKIPLNDTKNTTAMEFMFDGCKALEEVPLLDTGGVHSFTYVFRGCTSLKTVPVFNMKNATGVVGIFFTCTKLETIPAFDFRNVTSYVVWIHSCESITEIWIKNIKAALQVGSGASWGHLLTLESLIHLIYELRDTGSSKTLTVGIANLEKLANVYVKTVEITDEMRAEDDLVDEKLPFVVCESTDEGAYLIEDYVNLKNWQLQ